MGILYDFAILYFVLLANVFDFVCFVLMPKSLTCGYSISVPDTSVVGYH